MYSVLSFGNMITDSGRMDAYVQALRSAVKPDSVVVDIGTGTGIFAMLACQFGARKVYAIEPSDAINLAKEMAVANNLADKIEFIQDVSTNINLPELADVIISDLRGVTPLFQQHIPSIVDARQRLLAPDGILIPLRDKLWAAIVEADAIYKPFVIPWTDNIYDLDMRAGQAIVTNTWRKDRVTPQQLLVEPYHWVTLDYTSIESPNVAANITWEATRNGTAHGVILWFDAFLTENIGFSNAPDKPHLIYGNAFFPLAEAVDITIGDEIEVSLQASLISEDYIWKWDTKIHAGQNPVQSKANFKQSTFYGMPLSLENLSKQASNYVPSLSEQALIDLMILDQMQQKKKLGSIAEYIQNQFPNRFLDVKAALTYVGALALKYDT